MRTVLDRRAGSVRIVITEDPTQLPDIATLQILQQAVTLALAALMWGHDGDRDERGGNQ